ncbi:cytochrome b [Rubrivivax gelatinosus]|nr:cytochrome b [Rubrivivax gelatinosus]
MAPTANPPRPVRVWDLPTRLFHWALAATIAVCFVSGKVGGNAMQWHFISGYVAFGLVVFRLVWGLVGGRWSRFASFIYGPGALLRYLKGRSRPDELIEVGHNPLGSFSVFALLGIVSVQVATGLVADDEIANTGPLWRFVSGETALDATAWHKGPGQWIIIGLVSLHVASILFHRLKGHNLLLPMFTGDKPLPPGTPASADGLPQRLMALVLGAGVAALVNWVVSLGQL